MTLTISFGRKETDEESGMETVEPESREENDDDDEGGGGDAVKIRTRPNRTLLGTQWMYENTQIGMLKQQFVHYTAQVIRWLLKQDSELNTQLMAQGNHRRRIGITSSKGMVGECIQALCVRSEFPQFKGPVGLGAKLI
jgi:hypothetical protein